MNQNQTSRSNTVSAAPPVDAAESHGPSDVLQLDRNSPAQQKLAKVIGWDGVRALAQQQAKAAAKLSEE